MSRYKESVMRGSIFLAVAFSIAAVACQPPSTELTEEPKAAMADSMTQLAAEMQTAFNNEDGPQTHVLVRFERPDVSTASVVVARIADTLIAIVKELRTTLPDTLTVAEHFTEIGIELTDERRNRLDTPITPNLVQYLESAGFAVDSGTVHPNREYEARITCHYRVSGDARSPTGIIRSRLRMPCDVESATHNETRQFEVEVEVHVGSWNVSSDDPAMRNGSVPIFV